METALGTARRSTEGKKRPVTFRPSGSKDMKKEGYPSMSRSMSVIWIGTKGKGIFSRMQAMDSKME